MLIGTDQGPVYFLKHVSADNIFMPVLRVVILIIDFCKKI